MLLEVQKSFPSGSIKIPGSKSHTIRAVYVASLAEGQSTLLDPLRSADTNSAMAVCRALGARIDEDSTALRVTGFGGVPRPYTGVIDVGNSGTSLRLGVAVAAMGSHQYTFTGDSQIQSRPMLPLINALCNLGAEVRSLKNNDMAPLIVHGPVRGGKTTLDAVSSQFLTALLVACPLCPNDTRIELTRLNERPYVEMTLWWLDKLGIRYEIDDSFTSFSIPGRQKYKTFSQAIPADFSSATFFMAEAAISGREFLFENLDMTDTQGDKAVLSYLKKMGARVTVGAEGIRVQGGALNGCRLDLNATPDALPAMAVAGCFAEGETTLCNVPQARLKETDRIAVMCSELKKMGADIQELADGLVVRKSPLNGCAVSGHADHRVVMALSLAGMNAGGKTVIDTAEAVNVTFPTYVELMQKCGAKLAYVQ